MPAPDSSSDNLVDLFCRAASGTTASVERITTAALTAALRQATVDDQSVLLALSGDVDPALFAEFAKDPKVISAPEPGQLPTVPTGVTDAFCGVAATGSVCIAVSSASPVSMLTRRHIVILRAASIVPRPRDVLSESYLDGKGLRTSFSFITGPSATADMGPLVRGVHGPGKLHIIILE